MMRTLYFVGKDFEEARRFNFVYLNRMDAVTAATFFNAPENDDVQRKVWALDLQDVDPEAFKEIEV